MVEKEADRSLFLDRTIFTYSIAHLSATDKVRFYYALKGRDGESGIIASLSVNQLGKTVLMASSMHDDAMSAFLSSWNCPFSKLPVMIPVEVKADNTNHHPRSSAITPLGKRRLDAKAGTSLSGLPRNLTEVPRTP